MGSIEYMDARNGFRDMTFEQSVNEIEGLNSTDSAANLRRYVRINEDLNLGNASLVRIVYTFEALAKPLALTAAGGRREEIVM